MEKNAKCHWCGFHIEFLEDHVKYPDLCKFPDNGYHGGFVRCNLTGKCYKQALLALRSWPPHLSLAPSG